MPHSMSLPPARNRKGTSSSNEKGEGGREDDSNEKGEGGREDDPAATERATTPSGLGLSPPPPQKQRRLRLPNPRFSDSTYSSIPGRANSEAPDVPGASGKNRASPSTPSSPSDELRRQRRRQRRRRELPDAAPAKESEPAQTSHGWNLRRRRPAAGADDLAEFRTSAQTLASLRLAPDSANPKSARKPRPAFSFALSREEIEADFLKISGTKPCARPKKKRPYPVQNILNQFFPGTPLSAIITNSISNKI